MEETTLYIKNMVCDRCIAAVTQTIRDLGLNPVSVTLGVVKIEGVIVQEKLSALRKALEGEGFKLLDDKQQQTVWQIKSAIIELVHYSEASQPVNLSTYLSNKLGAHPVSLSAEGYVSLEMEKVLNAMPGANQGVKAQLVLEINADHPVAEKLRSADDETVVKYTKLLYSAARLIAGLDLENPTEFSDTIVELM